MGVWIYVLGFKVESYELWASWVCGVKFVHVLGFRLW